VKEIDISDISSEIQSDLLMYSRQIEEDIDKEAKKIAGETVVDLKNESNVGERGLFSKGWKSTVKKEKYSISIIIHNKEYRLTHLINDGHKMRQGGRARAFRLITKNEAKAHQKFFKIVGDIIDRH
jgi:hypothetical protein